MASVAMKQEGESDSGEYRLGINPLRHGILETRITEDEGKTTNHAVSFSLRFKHPASSLSTASIKGACTDVNAEDKTLDVGRLCNRSQGGQKSGLLFLHGLPIILQIHML